MHRNRPSTRAIAFALLALGALACAAMPPAPSLDELARPPFLKVEAVDGPTLFLLGTLHVGPSEGWHFSPEIETAIAEADVLVLEVDLDAIDQNELGSAIASRAILQGGRRLPDVISEETRALLEANDDLLASIGLTAKARSLYEPWFVAVGLVEVIANRSDYGLEAGAEHAVTARFGGDELRQLETFTEQLDLFDTLPLAYQDLLLRDTLSRLDAAHADLESLVQAWRSADRNFLIEAAREGVDEFPELNDVYDVLLDARNRRWVTQLAELADDPDRRGQTILVAVGALHVVGDSGVPRLLEAAGREVVRIH